MARKRKSELEGLIDLTSMLPWWGGVTLAIISFFLLNYISNLQISKVTDASQLGSFLFKQGIITFAMFGKYVLPFAFAIAAIVSFINQKKREKLFSKVEDFRNLKNNNQKSPRINPIEKMSWREFELVISQFFKNQGYSVIENTSVGPDGGIDLRIKKNGKTILVQCKHWKSQKVGVQVIREQLGLQFSNLADGTIVVTSGTFTDEAIRFANENNVTLLGGSELLKIKSNTELEPPTNFVRDKEICPICSAPMLLRVARKGNNAGKKFWGCSRFPQCKGIKNT